MKKSKRILALVLVLALAFTSFAMLASADTAEGIQPRGISCPECGTWVDTRYEREFITQVWVGSCSNRSYGHYHNINNVYEVENCSNCSYYNRSYVKGESVCA